MNWPSELAKRYVSALITLLPWALAAVLVLSLVPLWWRFGARKTVRRGMTLAVSVLGAFVGFTQAWVSDDAFISFRYAKNLVDGVGLVFNPGERVEGYTNFLWTLMSAAAIALGAHPGFASIVLSIASFVGVVWLSSRLAERVIGDETFFPLAAIVVAFNYTMTSFATSGLETMFAALLVLGAVERAEAERPLQAGLLGTLATLAHPDHALFYAGLGVSVLLRRRWVQVVRYAVPFALLYLPYLGWRVAYYGEWFPNTYYAKSGGLAYFEQGVPYLVICMVASGIVALVPPAIAGAVIERRRHIARFALFAVVPYLVYIAKIGGDFMLGRLLVPVVPVLAVLAELGANHWLRRGHPVAAGAALALAALAAVPTRTLVSGEKFHHVADERTFYEVERWEPFSIRSTYQRWADVLERHVTKAGLEPVFGLGCLGIIGYQTGIFIVDTFGLNDRNVARKPLVERARPGHEKMASPEYFLSRGVDFSDFRSYPPAYDDWTRLVIEGIPFHLGRYHPKFVGPLRQDRAVRTTKVPQKLDRYAPPSAAPRLACDLWFFESFYFAHNDDPARLRRLRERIVTADPTLEGYETLLLGPAGSEWREVERFDFSAADFGKWQRDGRAFAKALSREGVGQGTVVGHTGTFASSFASGAGDRAKGRLVRRFPIRGEVITLMVGGGGHGDGVEVRLTTGTETIHQAMGCRSEALGRRVWPVAGLRGQEATLEIVDNGRGGWGHIIVDEIQQWERATATP